jgi:hypothetical protein
MATVKCPECGERVKVREEGSRVRCPECGKSFRADEEDDPRPRSKPRPAKGMSGTKLTAIIVGGVLTLAVVALVVVLIVRKGGNDGATAPIDSAKVTVENFDRVKPGMDLKEVEGILGGSRASSEEDMRNEFRKALGEMEAAFETGFSRFTEGTEWRRWEGSNFRVWIAFGQTKEGKRAAFSTALVKTGNTYKQQAGFFTWGGEFGHDLDELNTQRKQEDAIRNDSKWVRGPQARELLIGDWRKADLDGYVFHPGGKLTTYEMFSNLGTEGKDTTFRVLDDNHVELLPPSMHPNLPSRPQKHEFRVNRDELVLLHVGQSSLSAVRGPYYRVPVEPGRPGYTNVLAPLVANLKSGVWGKQFEAFRGMRKLGSSGAILLPTLVEFLRGADENVASEAAGAIGGMGEAAVTAIPALVELLRLPNTKRGQAAVYALGNIGPKAAEVLPTLRTLLANSKEFHEYPWRDALTYAIGRIEGKKP